MARAAATNDHPSISYAWADLEHLKLPEAAFDLVYSSLALHYVEDLDGLFRAVVEEMKSVSGKTANKLTARIGDDDADVDSLDVNMNGRRRLRGALREADGRGRAPAERGDSGVSRERDRPRSDQAQ